MVKKIKLKKEKSHVYIGKGYVITVATMTHGSDTCTCLGHLGQCNRDRNDPLSVMLPKVAKESTIVTVVCRCCWHYHLK
jgi:hypothetical protein